MAAYVKEYDDGGMLQFVFELDWSFDDMFNQPWTRLYDYTDTDKTQVTEGLKEWKKECTEILKKKTYEKQIAEFEKIRDPNDTPVSWRVKLVGKSGTKSSRKKSGTKVKRKISAADSDQSESDAARSELGNSDGGAGNVQRSDAAPKTRSVTRAELSSARDISNASMMPSSPTMCLSFTSTEASEISTVQRPAVIERRKVDVGSVIMLDGSANFEDSDRSSAMISADKNKQQPKECELLVFDQERVAMLEENGAELLLENGELKNVNDSLKERNQQLSRELRELRRKDSVLTVADLEQRKTSLDNGWRNLRKRYNRKVSDLAWFQQTFGFKRPLKSVTDFGSLSKSQQYHYFACLRKAVEAIPGGDEFKRRFARRQWQSDEKFRDWTEEQVTAKLDKIPSRRTVDRSESCAPTLLNHKHGEYAST